MTAPPVTTTVSPEEIKRLAAEIADAALNSSHRRQKLIQIAEDAARLRLANEKLEAQIVELKAKAPKDGAVSLTKEEGEAWAAYVALGKPADLKTLTVEHADLKTKQAERDAEEQYADAAEALGWENVAVATRWLKREPIVLTFADVRTKDDEGKTVVTRTPMVRPKADEKATPVPLADYVDENAPEFADIFASAPAEGEEGEGEGEQPTRHVPRGTSANSHSSGNANGNGGVPIAAMRGARMTATPVTRDKKKLEEIEAASLKTGAYSG